LNVALRNYKEGGCDTLVMYAAWTYKDCHMSDCMAEFKNKGEQQRKG